MSASNYVTIWCDHGASPENPTPCGEHWLHYHTGARAARRDARTRGWRYVPGHPTTGKAQDLCPKHARERAAGGGSR